MIILYIDDDEDDCQLFKEAVKIISPHYVCLFANDAGKALQSLSEFTPDYIFLDINMPGVDGISFLRTLKQSNGFRQIPVVMLTTSKSTEDKVECLKLGAVDFISKPSVFSELCRLLKAYL